MSEFKMIAGLGNPGNAYVQTRHNAGFEVIDVLAQKLNIAVKQKKFGALFGQGQFDNDKCILLKPQSFMNRSGQVVAAATGFYRIDLQDVLVISDDMALAPGMIRLRPKGSAGGHNGLADIIEKLGTEQFARLRVGIGSSGPEPAEQYVLNRPSPDDRAAIAQAIQAAAEAAIGWMRDGIDKAMNEYNKRSNNEIEQ